MCKKSFVRASRASHVRSLIPPSHALWLLAFAIVWTMIGAGGVAFGQVVGVDDPADMADSSGDIKRVEAWVEEGNLHLTMTVYGVFAPSTDDTPEGMTNRYYYHWLLDTDNDPATGVLNDEYEGTPTMLETPIGSDAMIQFGWRNGATNGVYAYSIDLSTGDEVELFEDYEYTIEGDTIHAVIPLVDLGLTSDDTIAVSAFQEGASNGWQCDWIESVVLPLTVVMAFNPIPAEDSNDIAREVILGWSPGRYADTHDVYLGTVFDDVNNATRDNPLGVLVSEGQAEATFDPEGLLEFDTTYYWRIDEVNAAPDNTIYKGQVWSFTTEPYSYPIENIVATCNVESLADQGPENVVNESGLNELDEHSTSTLDMWAANGTADEPVQLQLEFDQVYKLDEMQVWNHNFEFETWLGLGSKNVTVEYSVDGTDWTTLGDVELAQAPGLETYTPNTIIPMEGIAAQSVRLTINSSWGGDSQVGLSEVRIMYIPVRPRYPEPVDGAVEVPLDTELAWRAGRDAASHEVYLGTDPEAIVMVGTTTQSQYVPPMTLDLGRTYYWRVDEVNEAEAWPVWTGPVWSFSTLPCIVIDDFEDYIDDATAGDTIWEAWTDGWVEEGGDPDNGGSVVGNSTSPFAEQDVVYAGKQSMPLYFTNTNASSISEADYTLSPAQDWTANGAATLSFWFHGSTGNTGQLYVKINDTQVLYGGAAADIAVEEWQPFDVDLSDVAADLANVTSLSVGVQGTGSGVVYIDDIAICGSGL